MDFFRLSSQNVENSFDSWNLTLRTNISHVTTRTLTVKKYG